MNSETVINTLTSLVGLAAVIFGLSKETTTTIVEAIPSIVGGVMAICSTVAFLYHKRKTRTEVFNKIVENMDKNPENTASSLVHSNAIEAAARSVGMI